MSQSTNILEPTNVVSPATAPAPIDPNTGIVQPAMPPAPTPAMEQKQFVDEWAKAPSGDAPTRTWLDASAQQTPEGQYLSAWYDTPVAAAPAAPAGPAHATQTVAPPPPAAAPAAPAAPAATPAPTPAPWSPIPGQPGFTQNADARDAWNRDYTGAGA
jgi:DNA polymerase-3 subunit gamma/tau